VEPIPASIRPTSPRESCQFRSQLRFLSNTATAHICFENRSCRKHGCIENQIRTSKAFKSTFKPIHTKHNWTNIPLTGTSNCSSRNSSPLRNDLKCVHQAPTRPQRPQQAQLLAERHLSLRVDSVAATLPRVGFHDDTTEQRALVSSGDSTGSTRTPACPFW
jgi:hypothetical protein